MNQCCKFRQVLSRAALVMCGSSLQCLCLSHTYGNLHFCSNKFDERVCTYCSFVFQHKTQVIFTCLVHLEKRNKCENCRYVCIAPSEQRVAVKRELLLLPQQLKFWATQANEKMPCVWLNDTDQKKKIQSCHKILPRTDSRQAQDHLLVFVVDSSKRHEDEESFKVVRIRMQVTVCVSNIL